MSRRATQSHGADKKPLARRVAVVAGATRGAGRGIARALGEAGATVYCTGRSVRGDRSPYGLVAAESSPRSAQSHPQL